MRGYIEVTTIVGNCAFLRIDKILLFAEVEANQVKGGPKLPAHVEVAVDGVNGVLKIKETIADLVEAIEEDNQLWLSS